MAPGKEDREANSKKEDRHLMQKKSHPARISTLQTPTMKRFLILPLFCCLLFGEERFGAWYPEDWVNNDLDWLKPLDPDGKNWNSLKINNLG